MSTSFAAPSKRDQIMATAHRLFYRDGYRAVGIDTILAEAGVAKMTLYHHFGSKEALIIAVLERRDHEFRAAMTKAVDAAGRSPSKRLLAVFDWHAEWFGSDEFKGCAFIRALSEFPERDHPVHRVAWHHKLAVRKFLEGLNAAAGARDPHALAFTFSLLIDGAIIAAHATGSTKSAIAARATAAALLESD